LRTIANVHVIQKCHLAEISPIKFNDARFWLQNPGHYVDECGFSCSICSNDSVNFTFLQKNGDVFQYI
jgi:hypothetical protein